MDRQRQRETDHHFFELAGSMPAEGYISLPNVTAISFNLVLICQIEGKRYGIARWAIRSDSQVQFPGDRGTLVIKESIAQNLGLRGKPA